MRRLVETTLALAALALALAAAPPAHAGGSFLVDCSFAKFAQVDPIVAFGRTSEHLHVFKGNLRTGARTTYAHLREMPHHGTTCTRASDRDKPGSGDLSSYWAPTLVRHERDGRETRVPLANSATYYRTKHEDPRAVRPFPPGLKMRAGNPAARTVQPWGTATMTCTNGGALLRRRGGGLQCLDRTPADALSSTLTMYAFFPSCWNGRAPTPAGTRTNTDDSRNMAYAVSRNGNGASPWTCPATHPIPVPELILIFGWNTPGGPHVHLSSHNEHGEHADFFEAWDPAVMQKLVTTIARTSSSPPQSSSMASTRTSSRPGTLPSCRSS